MNYEPYRVTLVSNYVLEKLNVYYYLVLGPFSYFYAFINFCYCLFMCRKSKIISLFNYCYLIYYLSF